MAKSKLQSDPAKLAHEFKKHGPRVASPITIERSCRAANCRHSEIAIVAPPIYDQSLSGVKDAAEAVYYCFKHLNAGEAKRVLPCKICIGAADRCKEYEPFQGTETIDLY